MNRHHLFYEDLDGDGSKEVISEINGTWNRVTVWSAGGRALYDASFGPGERTPARNMRDLDVGDVGALALDPLQLLLNQFRIALGYTCCGALQLTSLFAALAVALQTAR